MSEKLKNALNEAKKEKKKMLPELHALDDKIEDFIQKLENKINAVKDNPMFVKRAHQLLADMSKEYSEFIAALRAIVNAVDRKGLSLPKENPISKVRDVNSGKRGPEEEGQEAPPEEEGQEAPPKKGIKEALRVKKEKKRKPKKPMFGSGRAKKLPTKKFLSSVFGPEVMKHMKKGVDYE